MTMRLFNTLSIKHKIITSTLVICSLVIFLSYCVLIALELISFRKSMVNNMTSLASVVGINSTAALTFGDNETAMEILNALSTEPYIRTGCIYNQKGVLFAEYHSETGPLNKRFIPPRLLMLLPTHKSYDKSHFVFSTHHLDIFNPIRLGGKPIGTVFIRADLGHFYKKLIWSVAVLMVGMVGGLLLAFLMSYTLQKMIDFD